jgi:hypothetical protein
MKSKWMLINQSERMQSVFMYLGMGTGDGLFTHGYETAGSSKSDQFLDQPQKY